MILGKNALIVVTYELNFSVKSFQEKKTEIFPSEAFFSCVVHDFLSKCPNSQKAPLP